MKYMIASDIHGSAYYCDKLLEAFAREDADRLILLGDLLYHGPRNNPPRTYDPREVALSLNRIKDRILCVRGNCDADVDQMMLEFPIMAEYAVIDYGGRLIWLTHGHKYNIDNPLPLSEGDIMIYGHTHIPMIEEQNGITFINPGSVSIPKSETGHGYLILEDGKFSQRYLAAPIASATSKFFGRDKM